MDNVRAVIERSSEAEIICCIVAVKERCKLCYIQVFISATGITAFKLKSVNCFIEMLYDFCKTYSTPIYNVRTIRIVSVLLI